jgi:3-oxoacyl-[acyl-carrier protein] reductase
MTESLRDDIKESFIGKIPLSRFGEPKEVAEAIAFLLSNHSSYITGESLKINGGMYM